ncbi:ThiF family adenylyltransferase [Pseudomonas viridiflava]|uniref:Thiamine biosynthesis protein ThiF n=1 Tax=Pseudomonas viridiflava TaxID=33069 RepID=A0AA46VVJ8_PSEVI|nr:ThiF family adenylyltransferase [Pseudomonas viridiflava]UZA68694.1 thiamine biosynthesis protein ThiF [Pseudomonas viridiflava]
MGEVLPDLILEMQSRGFTYTGRTPDRWVKFEGPLITTEGVFQCDFTVDPAFFSLPVVKLKELPSTLGPVTPHLGASGWLCYLAPSTVVLDIFDPIGQTLRCLAEAESVLSRVVRGELVQDLVEEFFVHWYSQICVFDVQNLERGDVPAFYVASHGGARTPVITDDIERTVVKINAMQFNPKRFLMLACVVGTTAQPRPSQNNWPPQTVADIINWQRELDKSCAKKIQQRVDEAYKKKRGDTVIFIKSPLLNYGFQVHFDQSVLDEEKLKQARGTERLYSFRVTRLTAIRIDDQYIAQRSIPSMKTLAGLKIALVGCGTIGGYLADMLVKAGAGTAGGNLTLIDFDLLMPENVGRHRLGMPFSFNNKAFGLSVMLQNDAPGISVSGLEVNVRDAHLGDIELLIDATGEEALGHWLAANYASSVPMLSVWVEGPGTAVRALLKCSANDACYRCLSAHTKVGQFPTVEGGVPHVMAGHGCEGLYVPFPMTVSVQAAALGAEMALAWANGNTSPSLRTKVTDYAYTLASPDCNPPKVEDCPACTS